MAGPLADAAGLHATFLALSLPMLVLGIVAIFLPGLRDLDRPPAPELSPIRRNRPGTAQIAHVPFRDLTRA